MPGNSGAPKQCTDSERFRKMEQEIAELRKHNKQPRALEKQRPPASSKAAEQELKDIISAGADDPHQQLGKSRTAGLAPAGQGFKDFEHRGVVQAKERRLQELLENKHAAKPPHFQLKEGGAKLSRKRRALEEKLETTEAAEEDLHKLFTQMQETPQSIDKAQQEQRELQNERGPGFWTLRCAPSMPKRPRLKQARC